MQKPDDQVRLFVLVILQTPIGFVMNTFLTQPGFVRYLYSLVIGIFIQVFMFRESVYHIYIYAAVVYIAVYLFPKTQHKFVLPFIGCYLAGQHIYRMVTDFGGWKMDATTYTMILVVKLWMFSLSIKDGHMAEKDLLPREKEMRINGVPSVLEYMSYVCFCCGTVVGPSFEFADFKNFINFTGHYKDLPRGTQSYKALLPAL